MLDGFTVGITADRRADEQAALFERRGATVALAPAIRTLPLGDDEGLRAATEAVIASAPQALIANTGLGIRSWFGAAESWDLGDELLASLARTRIYARGPKAAGAIHSLGLDVQVRALSERLRECVDLVLGGLTAGDTVVVQRDGGPSSPEVDALRSAGARVIEVPIYRWVPNDDIRPTMRLAEGVISGRVHAVTFTSAPALASWLELADRGGATQRLRAAMSSGRVVVGCVGPACAEVLEREGLASGDVVIPPASRLGSLVRAVSDRLVARSIRVGDLVITGTVVCSGSRRVELSDIEARILAVLAERAGTVVSKVDLLQEVWGEPDGDPHLVEVAVGRLRRRLGPDGAMVAAVARRGYVLR
ncbi:MAG: uroporphyrinogen-III synthase [Actinomycetota bacterium]